MTNTFAAKEHHDGISFIGLFRAGEHGSWRKVEVNGETARFRTGMEARLAAHEALAAYMTGNYVSHRQKAEHRWEAGKLFRAGKRSVEVVKV